MLNRIDEVINRYREVQHDLQYDVFISYKHTLPDGGGLTIDSEKARELYEEISKTGLKVFYAPQAKLVAGREFEPHIISALNSARVMIVVGTCREYLEAKWVQNEWRRYQWLMQNDRRVKRTLFCYLAGGMQVRDLPPDLNNGIQAITDGIMARKKLYEALQAVFPNRNLGTGGAKPARTPAPAPASVHGINLDNLYQRAMLFL